jgi:hypothetical protein
MKIILFLLITFAFALYNPLNDSEDELGLAAEFGVRKTRKTLVERLARLMAKAKKADKAATLADVADYDVHIENMMSWQTKNYILKLYKKLRNKKKSRSAAEKNMWDEHTTYDEPCTVVYHVDPITNKEFQYQNYFWTVGDTPDPQQADTYEVVWRFPGGVNVQPCKPPPNPVNVCTCDHGIEATGDLCTSNYKEICVSCFEGYELDSNVCIEIKEPEKCNSYAPSPSVSDMEDAGRDCKYYDGAYHCINANRKYPTLGLAWKKCGEVEECAWVFRISGSFLLRAIDDPVETRDDGQMKIIKYHCAEAAEAKLADAQSNMLNKLLDLLEDELARWNP